jgi:hypothetical protein
MISYRSSMAGPGRSCSEYSWRARVARLSSRRERICAIVLLCLVRVRCGRAVWLRG